MGKSCAKACALVVVMTVVLVAGELFVQSRSASSVKEELVRTIAPKVLRHLNERVFGEPQTVAWREASDEMDESSNPLLPFRGPLSRRNYVLVGETVHHTVIVLRVGAVLGERVRIVSVEVDVPGDPAVHNRMNIPITPAHLVKCGVSGSLAKSILSQMTASGSSAHSYQMEGKFEGNWMDASTNVNSYDLSLRLTMDLDRLA